MEKDPGPTSPAIVGGKRNATVQVWWYAVCVGARKKKSLEIVAVVVTVIVVIARIVVLATLRRAKIRAGKKMRSGK